eukprot:TRINITY_DN24925_c0_g1_i1.p1 TRINITY_DN24925_c0_g1~~TRINITY_DN24925_c0_g1_i1.p1  ORF type:complete len:151 (-),score=6.29 TRINITY_DN24925_c0_g1_i1:192-644(-)
MWDKPLQLQPGYLDSFLLVGLYYTVGNDLSLFLIVKKNQLVLEILYFWSKIDLLVVENVFQKYIRNSNFSGGNCHFFFQYPEKILVSGRNKEMDRVKGQQKNQTSQEMNFIFKEYCFVFDLNGVIQDKFLSISCWVVWDECWCCMGLDKV